MNVVATSTDALPFPDASFDLVTSRHPVKPHWPQIARVLTDHGTYFAQHVGPASAFELIEHFLGPLPRERQARDPQQEAEDAAAAGLETVQLRTARLRMQFHDIGAIVWTCADACGGYPTSPSTATNHTYAPSTPNYAKDGPSPPTPPAP